MDKARLQLDREYRLRPEAVPVTSSFSYFSSRFHLLPLFLSLVQSIYCKVTINYILEERGPHFLAFFISLIEQTRMPSSYCNPGKPKTSHP